MSFSYFSLIKPCSKSLISIQRGNSGVKLIFLLFLPFSFFYFYFFTNETSLNENH